MNHYAAPSFWAGYKSLPGSVQAIADKAFDLMKKDPRHPSLHLKKVGTLWSARVGLHHRVLGVEVSDGFLWFWIGTHAEYDNMIG